MNEKEKKEEALFRLSVLGSLVYGRLEHGELKAALDALSQKTWVGPDGKERVLSPRTLEAWYRSYREHGFNGLIPKTRKDKGKIKAIPLEIQELILGMKREDPGRSVPFILEALRDAGRIGKDDFSPATARRLLRLYGLSGPKRELKITNRYRFQASLCGELLQGDACHTRKLFDPSSGREPKVKIFALLDDKSRRILYAKGFFHEDQEAFLEVLLEAILRGGIPSSILLDNHGSFTGADVRLACAQLGIRLVFARPYDGPSKGKIERFWRTLRMHFLDRLDWEKIQTLDDLNLRLMAWVQGVYNNRPHHGIQGRTPLSVWEEDAEEIRWAEDTSLLEKAFTASLERKVLGDSTLQFRGKIYEAPPHLRRQKVVIQYSLLRAETLWIQDGDTRIFLQEVDPQANFHRSRSNGEPEKADPPPKTGIDPNEELLKRLFHPKKDEEDGDGGEEGLVHA